MYEFTCPICESHDGFVLMPDYSASGLWCKSCGISFGNPDEEFPLLPAGLVYLIDVWVVYWDRFASEKGMYNYDYHHAMYIKTGQYLNKLMNQYYPCVFRDDRWDTDVPLYEQGSIDWKGV